MSNGNNDRTSAWLTFLQSLAWPLTIILILIIYHGDIGEFLGRTGEITAGTSGISLKAVKNAQEQVVQALATETARSAQAPADPAPTPAVRALVERKQALQTLITDIPTDQVVGWMYSGPFANGRSTKPPNLDVPKDQLPQIAQAYRVVTDTYLREAPPRGSSPKGGIIRVVPEGMLVRVLEVAQQPDPNDPAISYIWVQVAYKSA